jgi:hypothetical protein
MITVIFLYEADLFGILAAAAQPFRRHHLRVFDSVVYRHLHELGLRLRIGLQQLTMRVFIFLLDAIRNRELFFKFEEDELKKLEGH